MSIILENAGVVKPTVSSYLWEIKNFSAACKNIGESLVSPVFSTNYSSNKQEWRLWLFPKGYNENYKDYISLYIKYSGLSSVNVRVAFSLLDKKNCKISEITFQELFNMDSPLQGFGSFREQKFVFNKTNQIIVKDTIIILCEIIYDSKLAIPFKKVCSKANLADYSRLKEFDDFEKLLDAENSADVTVTMGKHNIKVHKAIIMNRSPVFKAMFEHDMKEKEQNIVVITDIKYEVMKEVFRFMYTGKVNGVERLADDLIVAAEKYSIMGLKVLCEKHILKILTVENVIEYLNLAMMCSANNLKAKIIKFIVHNKKDIVHKPELKLLPSEVVCEVLSAVVGNKPNK